jgi:hypothetical protein
MDMRQALEHDRSILRQIRARIARWLAPEIFELLRQREPVSSPAGPIPEAGLEVEMSSRSDALVEPASAEQKGPPKHWLAKVREAAPELLLSEEEGGPPWMDADAPNPPAPPFAPSQPKDVRESRPLTADRPDLGAGRFPAAQTGEGNPSRQEPNLPLDLERSLAVPSIREKRPSEQRFKEPEQDIRRRDRVVESEIHSVDIQNRGLDDSRTSQTRTREDRLSELKPYDESHPTFHRETKFVQASEAGVAKFRSAQKAIREPHSNRTTESDGSVAPMKLDEPVKVPYSSRPSKIQPQGEKEQREPSKANLPAQGRLHQPERQYGPPRSHSSLISTGSDVSFESGSAPSSRSDESQLERQITERTIALPECLNEEKTPILPRIVPGRRPAVRTARWPKLLTQTVLRDQSNSRLSDMQRESFLLREQRGGD